MSDEGNGDIISRADYERLTSQYDLLLQENAALLQERRNISLEVEQLNTANSQLRREVRTTEIQVRELMENNSSKGGLRGSAVEEGGVCEDCLTHLGTIQELQGKAREELDVSSGRYERMVDYYDNVLRERAVDLQDLQAQNSEVQEENSNLVKILRSTVGGKQKATPEQIQNFRRVSRVSAISGPAPIPRDIDKDQLITQLTNELNRANASNTSLDNSLSETTANSRSQIEYLESQIEQHELEKGDIISEIQAKLEDRDFLLAVFQQKKAQDPAFVKQLLSEGRRSTSHDMESEEDLEFRLRQKCDEVRVLERELHEADEHRQTLEKQVKQQKHANKELSQVSSQYKYAKDSLDHIVQEYCTGALFPKKPDSFRFNDEKLTALVTTLHGHLTTIKSLGEDVKWLEMELEKQNEDQKTVKIENLEKLVASQREQIAEHFEDTKKHRGKIQDLEDEVRNKQGELEELYQQNHSLEQEQIKHRERIDETDMRYADLEDEFHQFKKEVDDEKRGERGSNLKNLQLHSQVWILKNRISKVEKEREEVTKNNEILHEELQMARDKLEAASLQMAEQEKTSRRVSTILKPGGNLKGKDAIIEDLKDSLKRQKLYNDKLEKKVDEKQKKLRELEDKIRDITFDRDSVKDELQRSFTRMDSEEPEFQENSSAPLNLDLLLRDPKERHISVDYTIQEEDVHEQYNEVVQENEELKFAMEEIKIKLKRCSTELERERLYVVNVETIYEGELLKRHELQEKLNAQNLSRFDSSLPVIQESFEESMYDGTLTNEGVQELLDKLTVLQEELDNERTWVEHLVEQNEQFRIDLTGLPQQDMLSSAEKEELMRKYSETEDLLNERMRELEEAQRTIEELCDRLREYQERELKYRDDVDNVSEQLEHVLVDLSEHELKTNVLTIEKTEMEIQVRELKDENRRLLDKTVTLQEELITVREGKDVETTEKLKEEESRVEEANKTVKRWKSCSEESERNLKALAFEFENVGQELQNSNLKIESLAGELEQSKVNIEEKVKECAEFLRKMEEIDAQTVELRQRLDEVTEKEEQSSSAVQEMEEKVKHLLAEKEESNQVLKEKEEDLLKIMKKMDESDIDTVELKQKLDEMAEIKVTVKEKEETIDSLNDCISELKELLEKERMMNDKNRDLMNEMQNEVRLARSERQKAISVKVESEGKVKNIQKQCDDKVKMEQLMNEKNRETMNGMQAEVRRSRADRAITQTELIEATKTIKSLEDKVQSGKIELEKLTFEVEELRENNEVADLQSAMNSIQDAMHEMELRDSELMQTLEEKIENNSAIQMELTDLHTKLAESKELHKAGISDKDAMICALETALSEEMLRGDELEKVLEPFKNREFHDKDCQFSPETISSECQCQVVGFRDAFSQVSVDVASAEFQTTLTVEILVELEEKVEILEEELDKMAEEERLSCKQLIAIREELVKEQVKFKETVSTFEALAERKQELIDGLERESVEQAASLTQQLQCAQEENTRVKLAVQKTAAELTTLREDNQKLVTANNALQTEVDIQLEARNEIDTVIEDKEKEYLEIADKYNSQKITAKEAITTLKDEKQQLQNYLLETKKKLEDEMEQSKSYQYEASETINTLNNELRRQLLEQSYAHVLSSGSENDDHISTLPRPIRKSTDFKDALEETKFSVRALAKANKKLGHQIEKLLAEKDSFMEKSHEESNEIGLMKMNMNQAIAEKEKCQSATKQLELELMEREVSMEVLEENIVYLKRELENRKLLALKKSPNHQGTLTELHNLRHRCFMVIPSDPAREILHMFVSQYKDNLCSNCYARITTLGSRPATPRKKSPVNSPRKSDIVVQTEFTYGTDSAYSSSVSIQTEQQHGNQSVERLHGNQSVERLKVKTQQLSNDLADSKKSEKELELALQHQLKIAGELQKRAGRLERREKALLEHVEVYKAGEEDAEKREKQYDQLLQRYRGLKEELITSADHTKKLETELEEIRKRQNRSPPRSSTPDEYNTPPNTDCSPLYLSPIATRTSDIKLLCDRQCDTMSPLILTWADEETQTQLEEEEEEEEGSVQGRLLREIKQFTDKLCHTLKVEDDTLPTLTSAVLHKIEQLKLEKEVLEEATTSEMNRLQEELIAAKDELSKTEESALDIEEELRRVLDFQEEERREMQNKVKSFAKQFKTELEKARSDKKFAESALNKSIEKICEESNLMNEHHEQSLTSLREERDSLERKLEDLQRYSREDHEELMKERNELERQFFDYKIKSVAEKETLIESQTHNLVLLEKLKDDYEVKECQINSIQEQCTAKIDNLMREMKELEQRDREQTFEIEQLKNRIHQYTNREVDANEKLAQSQKIIDALKRDVLETRARLESLAGYEVKCGEVEAENTELRSNLAHLEFTKLTHLEEARGLKEAIERARSTINARVQLESYKNPALAAVAALWMQEREEVNDTKDALQATEWELQELRTDRKQYEERVAEMEDVKHKLNQSETERTLLKGKLGELQEQRIEVENEVESVKDKLNSSRSQIQVLTTDKEELQSLVEKHAQDKDKLLEDLNQSFKEKTAKEVRLEGCLSELSATQDQLFTVKEELVRNRVEAEKLRESLHRARGELDSLEKNISEIQGERDQLAAAQPKMETLGRRIEELELLNKSLSRRLSVSSEERIRAEDQANGVTEKLERDVTEILEAFEDYKQKTGTAPEKVQELKHGMAALQETLHQIMNSNSKLNKANNKLTQEIENLKIENNNISLERNEYRDQLESSMIDLSKDDTLLTQNQLLQTQVHSLSQRTNRVEKLEHDNTILKKKVRKMQELLRGKEDELSNLNESNEMREELEKENAHFKKMITALKEKLDKSKEASFLLKDKVRDLEESRDRFMSSTPNHSRSNRSMMDVSDEVEPIRPDSDVRRGLAADSRVSLPSLASQSRVSLAVSHFSSFETLSLNERCKTLDIELRDLKERYKILQETHDTEQNKAHEMSDALRNSVRILKNYIDRSGDVKGERMVELQDQLELQRSQLFNMAEQLGVDLAQPAPQHHPDGESIASGSTVCLDHGTDNQLI